MTIKDTTIPHPTLRITEHRYYDDGARKPRLVEIGIYSPPVIQTAGWIPRAVVSNNGVDGRWFANTSTTRHAYVGPSRKQAMAVAIQAAEQAHANAINVERRRREALAETQAPEAVNPKITTERILAAAERRMLDLDNPGFCLECGAETEGVEPDARRYICEECGAPAVYGAEEILLRLAS